MRKGERPRNHWFTKWKDDELTPSNRTHSPSSPSFNGLDTSDVSGFNASVTENGKHLPVSGDNTSIKLTASLPWVIVPSKDLVFDPIRFTYNSTINDKHWKVGSSERTDPGVLRTWNHYFDVVAYGR